MISPILETLAQVAVTRIVNSLPEGILLMLIAGAVLRVLPKQNSRTRFAVWFLALLAVTSLAFIGRVGGGRVRLLRSEQRQMGADCYERGGRHPKYSAEFVETLERSAGRTVIEPRRTIFRKDRVLRPGRRSGADPFADRDC